MKVLSDIIQVLSISGIFVLVAQFCFSVGAIGQGLISLVAVFLFVSMAIHIFFSHLESIGVCGRPHGDY